MSRSSYVALYDYQASDAEELSLRKGDRVAVISNSGQWWTVRNERGQEGLVPFNYLEEAPAQAAMPVATSNSRSKINQDEGLYQQTNLVMQPSPGKVMKAVARYRYQSRRADELGLEKGEEIIVLEKEGDGWWRGKCGNKEGWFPANYVEEVKVAEPPPTSNTPVVPVSKRPVICTVVALYSFESGNSEELPFQKGDLMDVIGQPPDDPEWWEARKQDGSHGLVPRNYVEVMHSSTAANGQARAVSPVSSSDCPFKSEHWFHGKISRQVAERLLVTRGKDGEYLVRDSEAVVSCITNYPKGIYLYTHVHVTAWKLFYIDEGAR